MKTTGFILASIVVAIAACDTPFLRTTPARQLPNDGRLCAPDAGAADVTLEATESSVIITWASNATNEDGFLIERRSEQSLAWGEVARVAADELRFSDFGAPLDTRLFYRVQSFRRAGASICASAPSDPGVVISFPEPPSDLRLRRLTATQAASRGLSVPSIELQWTDVNDFETAYRIEREADDEGFTVVTDLRAGSNVFAEDGLFRGSNYRYRVRAVRDADQSRAAEIGVDLHFGPGLAWGAAPSLADDCTLNIPGQASFDPLLGTAFESASGTVDMGGGQPTTADDSGVSSILGQVGAGRFDTSWTVRDSFGGETTITRPLDFSLSTTVRDINRRGTRLAGDDSGAGSQALLPSCSSCTGRRGQVGAGGRFSCALNADGSVGCWGSNRIGQMGRGGSGSTLLAHRVCLDPLCTDFLRAIDLETGHSASGAHSCARTVTGEVLCWGSNNRGQLGAGDNLDYGYATHVCLDRTGPGCTRLTGVSQLALGGDFTCVLSSDSTVWCWGDNSRGVLGAGLGTTLEPAPVRVCETGVWDGTDCAGGAMLTGVAAIAAGDEHACALMADTTVRCWGNGSLARLGTGNSGDQASPAAVCLTGQWDPMNQRCWDGMSDNRLTGIRAIGAADTFSCALVDADGSVKCWGAGSDGQLGAGDTTNRVSPVDVCATGSWNGVECNDGASGTKLVGADSLLLGEGHGCVMLGDEPWCWGSGRDGRLGRGTTDDALNPVRPCVSGEAPFCPRLSGVQSISPGPDGGCAVIAQDLSVQCWGSNGQGELGSTSTAISEYSPVPTCFSAPGGSCDPMVGIAKVRLSTAHGCALAVDGTVWCWGQNASNRLGLGTLRHHHGMTPTCEDEVGYDCMPLSAADLSVGAFSACAVLEDGRVTCWGANYHGELGNGFDGPNAPVGPSLVCESGAGDTCVPLSGITAVSVGGTVHTHGDKLILNSFDTVRKVLPYGAPKLGHACAVRDDGTLVCWGDNRYGQLGVEEVVAVGPTCDIDGDCVSAPAVCVCPKATTASANCISGTNGFCLHNTGISCTFDGICGSVNGTRYCDGGTCALGRGNVCLSMFDCQGEEVCVRNGIGRCTLLPFGNPTPQFVPCGRGIEPGCLPGAPLTNVIDVAAGGEHTCALLDSGSLRCWGRNHRGQVGPAAVGDTVPLPVELTLPNVVGVTLGAEHSCVLTLDGNVLCWGSNERGQLGTGSSNFATSLPGPVCLSGSGPTCELLQDVVAVSAGANFTCAVLGDGTARCWGDNQYAQLGLGFESGVEPQPRPVCAHDPANNCGATTYTCGSLLDNVVGISAGDKHACALRADGNVSCWGRNDEIQIGKGQWFDDPVCTANPAVCTFEGGICNGQSGHDQFAVRTCDVAAVSVPF